MSQHHQAAGWYGSRVRSTRARIRAAGQVQYCAQSTHVPDCPRLLDLDAVPWDAAHTRDLADGGPADMVGPAYRRCNRSAGGTRGARTTHAQHRDAQRMRAW